MTGNVAWALREGTTMSAIDDILGSIDPQQLASALGTDQETALNAAAAAIPTLINGLQANAGSAEGEVGLLQDFGGGVGDGGFFGFRGFAGRSAGGARQRHDGGGMAGCRAAAFGLLPGFALNANHFGLRNIGGFALGKNHALGPFHHEGDDDDFRGEDAKRQQERNRLEQARAGPLPNTRRDDFLILNAQVAQKKFIVVLEPDGPRDEFSVEPDGRVIRCLLYTSDAADDLLCVDLGGRRIIKKKTGQDNHPRPQHIQPISRLL